MLLIRAAVVLYIVHILARASLYEASNVSFWNRHSLHYHDARNAFPKLGVLAYLQKSSMDDAVKRDMDII